MDLIIAEIRDFDNWSARYLSNTIDQATRRGQKVLPVMINSPGGDVYALLTMLDKLQASGMEIITITNSTAMSCGAYLFAMGKKRWMSPNASLMIHEPSFGKGGTLSDVKNMVNHVSDITGRIFKLIDTQCNKPAGFIEGLLKESKGADLYFNAQQAIENGLATNIGIPTVNELVNSPFLANQASYSDYQKIQVLMKHVDISAKNKSISNIKGGKIVSLKALLESGLLDDDQKKIVIDAQKEIEAVSGLKNKITEIEGKLSQKEQEITSVKTDYESKIGKMVEDQDKEFITALQKNFQLSKTDTEKEIKVLASLSAIPEAKASYKEKLQKAPKVIEGQIPDSGERDYSFDKEQDNSPKTILAEINEYADKNKIDIATVTGYQKAYAAVIAKRGGKA